MILVQAVVERRQPHPDRVVVTRLECSQPAIRHSHHHRAMARLAGQRDAIEDRPEEVGVAQKKHVARFGFVRRGWKPRDGVQVNGGLVEITEGCFRGDVDRGVFSGSSGIACRDVVQTRGRGRKAWCVSEPMTQSSRHSASNPLIGNHSPLDPNDLPVPPIDLTCRAGTTTRVGSIVTPVLPNQLRSDGIALVFSALLDSIPFEAR